MIFHGTYDSLYTISWTKLISPPTSSSHLPGRPPSGPTPTSTGWGRAWWGASCGLPMLRVDPNTKTLFRLHWNKLIWSSDWLISILITCNLFTALKVLPDHTLDKWSSRPERAQIYRLAYISCLPYYLYFEPEKLPITSMTEIHKCMVWEGLIAT